MDLVPLVIMLARDSFAPLVHGNNRRLLTYRVANVLRAAVICFHAHQACCALPGGAG